MCCRATPHSRHHTTAQQARRNSILQVPVLSAYLGSQPSVILYHSDSTFGFGSKKSPTFIFWLYLFVNSCILCCSPPCDYFVQLQKHGKPVWSRLLTCTQWRTPPRPQPPPPGIQEAGMQMEDYLCSCNKRLHKLPCSSRTLQRRELLAKMT